MIKYCVIVQGPTDTHPMKTSPHILNPVGQKCSGIHDNLNEAYKAAEKEHNSSGKCWFYTVAECEE